MAQTEDAAVMLLEVRGYSQGFLLDFMVVGRPASAGGSLVLGSPVLSSPVLGVDFGSGVLLPGAEPSLADRGRAVHRLADETDAADVAATAGATGRTRGLRARLWITPLPPAEGFTVVTDWPEHRVEGQRGYVGGEAIRVAAWDSFPCLPA